MNRPELIQDVKKTPETIQNSLFGLTLEVHKESLL